MYRQPMYTGQRLSSESTFCSALIHKIRWKSNKHSEDEKENQTKPAKINKSKSENASSSDKENPQKNKTSKTQHRNEIKHIVAKLKKITSTLPHALRSSDAYERGVKGCETCEMKREEYKRVMQTVKIIDILVDGVIEKEQADLIDKETETQDNDATGDKTHSKKESSSGKGDRLSFQFEVYCEREVIKHNLKCVLITLQKQIGDTMVQICFVKTRELSNEERYKQFDASVSDLKLLKFEYTNLTDKIISSFKKPSKKKNSTEVCVACIKEKLTDYNDRLTEVLKSGRNLKLVMRNDSSGSQKQCCSRTYPHVHAEAQGKPVVLKYSMPFEIKNPSIEDSQLDNNAMPDEDSPSNSSLDNPPNEPRRLSENKTRTKNTPYDEWPEDFDEHDTEPPADKPTKSSAGPHAEPPADKPTKSSAGPHAEPPADKPTKSSAGPHAEPPADKPTKSSAGPHAEHPADKPTKSSAGPHAEPPADEPTVSSAGPLDGDQSDSKLSVNKSPEQQPVAGNSVNNPTEFPADSDASSVYGSASKMSSRSSLGKEKSPKQQPVVVNSVNKPTEFPADPDASSVDGSTSKMSSRSSLSNEKSTEQQPVAGNSAKKPTESALNTDASSVYESASRMSSKSSLSEKKFSGHQKSDDDSAMPENKEKTEEPDKKGSVVSSTKSSVHSTLDDDDSSWRKQKEKRDKRVSFYDQQPVTTLPVLLDSPKSTHSHELSRTNYSPSAQSIPNKTDKPATTPFGGDLDNVPIYVTAIDSVILTKYRMSLSDHPTEPTQDLQVDRAVVEAFKPFIDEPEYIKVNPTKPAPEELPSVSQDKESSPQNKKVEGLLNVLGKEDLRCISAPADCFDMNNLIANYGSISNLPFSASLYSLPLDYNDLNYISRLTGKQISPEDIMLVPEDEIPVKEYEWELKFAEDDPEENKTKWLRAYAGTDVIPEITNDRPTSSDKNLSLAKWTSVKNAPYNILPTIDEEEPHLEDNKPCHIPYMPSIPSLPLEEEDKQELLKKKPRPSIRKHNVMELRYFTVEFENKNVTNKMPKETKESMKYKSMPYSSVHHSELKIEKEFKSDSNEKIIHEISKKEKKEQGSCESFQSCCSSASGLSIGSPSGNNNSIDKQRTTKPKVDAIDEMIMLNTIHLCDTNREEKYVKSLWKSSKNNFSSSSIVSNELFKVDSCSMITNPLHCKHNLLHTVDEYTAKETDKEIVPKLFPVDNKITSDDKQNTQKKSYTVLKHEEKISGIESQTFQPQSFVVNKSYTIVKNCGAPLREPNVQTIVPDAQNPQLSFKTATETKPYNFVNESKDLKRDDNIEKQNKYPQGTDDDALKSQPTPINRSYTIVKGQNNNSEAQSILPKLTNDTNNVSLSKQNMFLKRSYTIIKKQEEENKNCKTKGTENNTSKKLKTEKVDVILQKQQTKHFNQNKNMIPGTLNQKNNYINKGYWSKLKIHNLNVKNYIDQHKSRSKESLKIKDYRCKNYKCLKRKPLIPMKSYLNYRRVECKIRMPLLKYTMFFPVLGENKISNIILKSKTPPKRVFEITNDESTMAGKVFGPFMKQSSFEKPNKEATSLPLIDYGLAKGYISVKKDQHPTNAAEFYKKKSKSVFHYKVPPSVPHKNFCKLGNEYLNTEMPINSSTESLKAEHNHPLMFLGHSLISSNSSLTSSYQPTNTSKSSIVSNKTNDYYLIDQNFNPLFLYDAQGRPVTDNSGRPLRNIHGEFLMKFDKKGLPISDSNSKPLFDTLGRSIKDTDFNPTQPLSTEVYKSFTSETGKPMLLFDIEGRPLTSVSGTMLFDASGKSLIRFGCAGNPISDSIGKPIFDSTGRNITD